jgi:hypothetical protein
VIFNGPRLLFTPTRVWGETVGLSLRPATWLIAAALTASVWPAASVVAGHLGSAALGHVTFPVAILRAVIGFMAVVGGALVMAPALTLVLLRLTRSARAERSTGQTVPVAMGLLWPAWTAGIILALPPLLGLAPFVGELLWTALVAIVVYRTVASCATDSLAIRRRWRWRFVSTVTPAFVALFFLISVSPALISRAILNLSAPTVYDIPDRPALPLPPESNW